MLILNLIFPFFIGLTHQKIGVLEGLGAFLGNEVEKIVLIGPGGMVDSCVGYSARACPNCPSRIWPSARKYARAARMPEFARACPREIGGLPDRMPGRGCFARAEPICPNARVSEWAALPRCESFWRRRNFRIKDRFIEKNFMKYKMRPYLVRKFRYLYCSINTNGI